MSHTHYVLVLIVDLDDLCYFRLDINLHGRSLNVHYLGLQVSAEVAIWVHEGAQLAFHILLFALLIFRFFLLELPFLLGRKVRGLGGYDSLSGGLIGSLRLLVLH
jgi:hypothetical protein